MDMFKNEICDSCRNGGFPNCKANFNNVMIDPVTRNIVDCDLYKKKKKHTLKITYECGGKIAVEKKEVYDLPELDWKDKESKVKPDRFKTLVPEEIWSEFKEFEEMRRKKKAPLSEGTVTRLIKRLNMLAPGDYSLQKEMLIRSADNCWKTVFLPNSSNFCSKRSDERLQNKPSYDLEKIKRDAMNNTDI